MTEKLIRDSSELDERIKPDEIGLNETYGPSRGLRTVK